MIAGSPATTPMMKVRGRELRVVHRPGDPGRTPLLLCNGIGASLEILDPLVQALDPARPVVRFDAPGIGGSARPVLPYRYSTMAMTLHTVLHRLGYQRADVLGVSWGGGLAQQMAFQYPSWCRRLVLASTATGFLMVPARPLVLARMTSPRRHRDPEYAARIAGSIYGGSARRAPLATSEVLYHHTRRPSLRGYGYQLAAIAGWASLPWLPLIRQPTLLLAGDDDPVIPPLNALLMSRLLPHVTMHRYEGGHLALLTEAHEFAPLIDDFLGEGDPV